MSKTYVLTNISFCHICCKNVIFMNETKCKFKIPPNTLSFCFTQSLYALIYNYIPFFTFFLKNLQTLKCIDLWGFDLLLISVIIVHT